MLEYLPKTRTTEPKGACPLTTQEEMLKRIRQALSHPHEGPSAAPANPALTEDLTGVMPALPPQELLPKFEAELAKVGGAHYRATSRPDLAGILHTILDQAQARGVVLSRNPLLAELGLAEVIRAWNVESFTWPKPDSDSPSTTAKAASDMAVPVGERGRFREACFAAQVGITGVDFALAETGSLVVTSATEGSQLSSLAPPVHVALYRRGQLVASLDDVLARLGMPGAPPDPLPGRSIVFITGTSRTADIEQILIKGVHGPREVHAILVEDTCLGKPDES